MGIHFEYNIILNNYHLSWKKSDHILVIWNCEDFIGYPYYWNYFNSIFKYIVRVSVIKIFVRSWRTIAMTTPRSFLSPKIKSSNFLTETKSRCVDDSSEMIFLDQGRYPLRNHCIVVCLQRSLMNTKFKSSKSNKRHFHHDNCLDFFKFFCLEMHI
jgi:hypothetical protein